MDWAKLESAIGYTFKNKKILEQAFTHRSYLNEHRDAGKEHNERLEFLGDAVLELVSTVHLYSNYPEANEGGLTAYRSALVNTNTLSKVSSELGFNNYLLLSKGESKDLGRARQYILANTFESVVAAIFLDGGYDMARDFIERHLTPLISELVEKNLWIDAKSRLQEIVQDKFSITPTYKTILEEGPDHDKYFTVGVFFKDEKVAEGRGKSKQEAEQEAARQVILSKKY